MSNHGNESTNKEGVNIDEMQTKIDMGKLITKEGLSTGSRNPGITIRSSCASNGLEK
jgi:hypothetical protein